MERILIVEDEEKMRRELCMVMERHGYSYIEAEDFERVPEAVRREAPDLVLLDLNLPVYDGFYICREIRETSDVPIIIVTSQNSDMDELMSLNVGADDFVTKPYNVHILLGRIATVLKRAGRQKAAVTLTHRGLTLELLRSRALYQEQEIELTKNELGILKILMENKGVIIPRNELIKSLWEMEEFVEDSTLTVNVNRLRKKLEGIGLCDYLVTKRGQGYMV